VRVTKEGFKTSEVRGLALDAAQTVRADVTLEVGSPTQAIEVQASAVQLQTEDAKSSTTLQNKLVNDLPLVVGGTVRTPFDLASDFSKWVTSAGALTSGHHRTGKRPGP
jgi:hypothetical protein